MEEWRPVVGYEGVYEVSDLGRVRSVDRWNVDSRGRKFKRSGRIIAGGKSGAGYPYVVLWRNSREKLAYVHRLVAEAFLPPIQGKLEVNHINGVKTDNRAENLEWCTSSENKSHAFRVGLKKNAARTVYRDDGAAFESARHAERETGVNHANIWQCCAGRRTRAGGCRWSYDPFEVVTK